MQDLLVELCAFTQTGWLSVLKHSKGLTLKDMFEIGSIDLIQVQGGRHPSGCSGDWGSSRRCSCAGDTARSRWPPPGLWIHEVGARRVDDMVNYIVLGCEF